MGPDGPSMLRDRPRGRRIGVPGGAGFGSPFILMKLGLTLIRVNPNCPAARGSARQSVGVRRHRMPCCAPTRGIPQRVHGAPTPRRATSERQRMGDGSRPSSLSKSTSRSKSDPAAVIYDNSYLSSVTGAAPSRPSSLGRISPSGGAACRAPLRARSARVSGVRATEARPRQCPLPARHHSGRPRWSASRSRCGLAVQPPLSRCFAVAITHGNSVR